MSSYRQRNKNGASSKDISSQLSRRRRRKVSSPPALLLNKCAKHPKIAKALFVAILFAWVGLVALLLSKIPSKNHNNGTISPLSARDNQAQQLRTPSMFRRLLLARLGSSSDPKPDDDANAARTPLSATNIKKHVVKKPPPMQIGRGASTKPHQRDRIANSILSRLPGHQDVKPPRQYNSKKMRERARAGGLQQMRLSLHRNNAESHLHPHENPAKESQSMESIQQSTLYALESSIPYAQKSSDNAVSQSYQSIYAFAAEDYLDTKTSMKDDDDSLDTYYAMDDDSIRGQSDEKDRYGVQQFCSTPSFYRLYRPNCNEVHSTVSTHEWLAGEEYTSNSHRSRYLGAGTYRQVFLLERNFASDYDEVVFKSMKRLPEKDGRSLDKRAAYNPEEVNKNFELYDDMRKDSMVMELLTSSPRIADIYSFCALSSIIEYAPGNIEKFVLPTGGESSQDDDPTPVNDIKPQKKLTIALELAKGIATMHGHQDGVIANVDVQVGQFCRGKDGLIKILDFNRAEVMMYDEDQEEYCKFQNGPPPDGALRAPEEIVDAPLTEKIDVYSLGNVFYSVLTGLFVNGDYGTQKAHWRITHGKTEKIDVEYYESRSPEEMSLIKAIQWCWTFQAEERPSIFEIVEFLQIEVSKGLKFRSEGDSQ
mmetsp:Transcript_27948/g.67338  ORF Transcript_27948/g.67338 Transcript_27948/m.67338 type:complete len:651 (+) Transcript_27948:355-2307(+)|eukprot:CAMPEP_0181094794 /NCGR_PEP_ID=MMETSP1071-20121207/10179_1 /TAXON_ID=35127 /ORGANISM="Thalassiosira sp., Strain NH16" /LENGTH=650 /DNA_ID=CAMNT_0023177139 /DNA_START=107 /DNA_END=2059 /DNA_ORIENTATION=+